MFKRKLYKLGLLYFMACFWGWQCSGAAAWSHDITFCGERIPVSNSFVANKLMNVIRQQVPYANMPQLRRDARKYFPMIEYCLKACGMPEDLKYIPIVESGFKNATSRVGAQGFWQLMPATAMEWGLQVNAYRDERNDIYKATIVALRELARTYNAIKRDHKISSWVLTAAAYNFGIGRMYNKINKQGQDYFTMNLNPETAVYVYKIIAIKELFEYPELYVGKFQYNIFNANAPKGDIKKETSDYDTAEFKDIDVIVKEEDKPVPSDKRIEAIERPDTASLNQKDTAALKKEATLISAQIVGSYKAFQDGDSVHIQLQENLQTINGFKRKGSLIRGKGWIIEDRVYIDLGFNSNSVILYDLDSDQGVPLASLRDNEQVILRVQN